MGFGESARFVARAITGQAGKREGVELELFKGEGVSALQFSKANRTTREQKQVVARTKKKQAEIEGEAIAALSAIYADLQSRQISQQMMVEAIENLLAIRDSADSPEARRLMSLITEGQIHDAANHLFNTHGSGAERMRQIASRWDDSKWQGY